MIHVVRNLLLLLSFLFFPSPTFAADTPSGWTRVEFENSQAFSYLNQDGISFFSVYPFDKKNSVAQKQFKVIAQSSEAQFDRTLLPASCYRIKKAEIKTSQTWCSLRNGGVAALVESGPAEFSDDEKALLVLGFLGNAK